MTGLGAVLRLDLRRERTALLAWVVGLGLLVATTFPAIAALYPDAAERATLAAGIGANPATVAITGPVLSSSVGGLSAWRIGVLAATGTALMALLTVVRRTRADEESGEAELVAATVVGRSAPLVAALLTAALASLVVGLVTVGAAVGSRLPAAGALDLGAVIAGSGLAFAAVGAVAAQLTSSARTATGIAGATLGAAFVVRAAADALTGLGWLRWWSPLGWVTEVGPFALDRAGVLPAYLAVAVAGAAAAVVLRNRRDLGSGWWAARPGPAGSTLGSPLALAGRLLRGGVAGWAVGLAVLGGIVGGVAADADRLLSGNPRIAAYFRTVGGRGDLTTVLIGAIASVAGLAVAGQGIAVVARWHGEETGGRFPALLAAPVSRTRLLFAGMVAALVTPVVSLVAGGLAAGLSLGARRGELARALGQGLTAMLIQLPAVWVMVGVAVALLGWWPSAFSLAWAALGVALVLGQVGALLKLPRIVLDLSPFTHVPGPEHVRWWPLVALTGVAVALLAAGTRGYARRDIAG